MSALRSPVARVSGGQDGRFSVVSARCAGPRGRRYAEVVKDWHPHALQGVRRPSVEKRGSSEQQVSSAAFFGRQRGWGHVRREGGCINGHREVKLGEVDTSNAGNIKKVWETEKDTNPLRCASSSPSISFDGVIAVQKRLPTMATTDLCDAYEEHVRDGRVRILPPMFQIYGSRPVFSGSIATVKVFEDNVKVREMVSEPGEGRVLVVDGGGSLRCALLGGQLVHLAHTNGWSGIVLNACVRDAHEINSCDIGVRALAAHPLRSNKKGHGEINVPLTIAGTIIVPGEWCYADLDGVVISATRLSI